MAQASSSTRVAALVLLLMLVRLLVVQRWLLVRWLLLRLLLACQRRHLPGALCAGKVWQLSNAWRFQVLPESRTLTQGGLTWTCWRQRARISGPRKLLI